MNSRQLRLLVVPIDSVEDLELFCHKTSCRWEALKLSNTRLSPGRVLQHCWSPANFNPPGPGTLKNWALLGASVIGATLGSLTAFPLGLILWPTVVAPQAVFLRAFSRHQRFIDGVRDEVGELLPKMQAEFLQAIEGANGLARALVEQEELNVLAATQRDRELERIQVAVLVFASETLYGEDPSDGTLFKSPYVTRCLTAEELVGDSLDLIEGIRAGVVRQ